MNKDTQVVIYTGKTTDRLKNGNVYDVIHREGNTIIVEDENKELMMDNIAGFSTIIDPDGTKAPIISATTITSATPISVGTWYFTRPKFNLGDVYDLRYTNDGLPNRIKIIGYVKTLQSGEWVYHAQTENLPSIIQLKESFIEKRISAKTAPVYELDVVKIRMNAGKRWAGNYTMDTCRKKAVDILKRRIAKSVFIREAYDRNGNLIPHLASLWIQHQYPINE